MPGHTSFGTRGSQVQILPLRPNKSRKIGRFLQRPERGPHLPGLLSGPKLGSPADGAAEAILSRTASRSRSC